MDDVFVPIIFGILGYLIAKCFIDPLVRVITLRKEMHEAILQYSNIWGIDPNDSEYSIARQHSARETFRSLAAQGISEYENLNFNKPYIFARVYLCIANIKLKEAAEKFWAMEADIASPDVNFRKTVVTKIRDYLKLPEEINREKEIRRKTEKQKAESK